jgi:hypothetical protein
VKFVCLARLTHSPSNLAPIQTMAAPPRDGDVDGPRWIPADLDLSMPWLHPVLRPKDDSPPPSPPQAREGELAPLPSPRPGSSCQAAPSPAPLHTLGPAAEEEQQRERLVPIHKQPCGEVGGGGGRPPRRGRKRSEKSSSRISRSRSRRRSCSRSQNQRRSRRSRSRSRSRKQSGGLRLSLAGAARRPPPRSRLFFSRRATTYGKTRRLCGCSEGSGGRRRALVIR